MPHLQVMRPSLNQHFLAGGNIPQSATRQNPNPVVQPPPGLSPETWRGPHEDTATMDLVLLPTPYFMQESPGEDVAMVDPVEVTQGD